MTTPARLEVRVSPLRMLELLGLTCLMVGGAYFCTTLPELTPRVVGWLGMAFFSLGFIAVPVALRRKGPQVVIDERGIEDRQLGLIPWEEIAALSVGTIHGEKFLGVHVVEPEKYLARLPGLARINARANPSLGFSPITIGFSGLSHSAEKVVAFIQAHYAARITG